MRPGYLDGLNGYSGKKISGYRSNFGYFGKSGVAPAPETPPPPATAAVGVITQPIAPETNLAPIEVPPDDSGTTKPLLIAGGVGLVLTGLAVKLLFF